MSAALRSAWQSVVQTKRAYLNPHEDFGRANIFRAALATYIGAFVLFKWNKSSKAAAIKAEQKAEKEAATKAALAKAGVL
uniref:ATP synthase subunit e, mitochondrial n=1 Tax=Panagrellus redivivus TaxID=6233 RepID=A0A7E4ZU31_PANRE